VHVVSPGAGDPLMSRLAGVLRSPRATFAALARAPRWADALAVTFVVSVACGAVLLETETGRLALVDQWERTAIAFGQPVDDARYASFMEASENGALYAVAAALASGPLLVFGVTTLLYLLFTRARGGTATYRQVLAVVAHAGIILALRQLVAAPLDYARETLASPMTLGLFFRTLDEGSPLARFFGVIDFFVLWWVFALGIGISVLYGRRPRPLMLGFAGTYVALAVVLALAMALTGGTA
jgi:hypothetical protein